MKKPILVSLILFNHPGSIHHPLILFNHPGSIHHPLVQLPVIPSIDHCLQKSTYSSPVHRNLISFLECPLVPLILSARVKNSLNFNLDSPLPGIHILKTSMRSCLFLRSSSVRSFKQYNLSSYDFPSILLIIFVNFLWTFSMSPCLSCNVDSKH